MQILFLSHYFPPEVNAPASRTHEHCKNWVRSGHDVTVVACVPHHPMGKAYPGYRNRLYHSEIRDGIKVIHLLTYIVPNEGFLKRTFNYLFYMIMVVLAAPFLKRPDVVISTSPQFFNGLAGYFVSRIKRVPWVLEIRDLWPESILAVGAIKNRTVIRLLEGLERFAYRHAERIVIVSHAYRDHIIARGGRPQRIHLVMNGVDLSRFGAASADASLRKELGLDDKFVVAYVGTHGIAHGLDTVLEAASLLRDDPDIVFLLIGDGAERQRLSEERDRRRLGNVLMLEQQPKQRMPALWLSADASLVHLRRLPLFCQVVPSKIFESMAMAIPVILAVEGAARELVEEARAGVCIEPENARTLAEAVRSLARNPEGRRAMGARGRAVVAEHYDRTRLAADYAEVLRQAIAQSGQGVSRNECAAA